jgi:hypothetical protein
MENTADFVKIYLQDIDGIIDENGTTYKIGNGAKLQVLALKYPEINLDVGVGIDSDNSQIIESSKTFSDYLGPVKFGGIKRPKVVIDTVLPIIDYALTNTQISALTTDSETIFDYYFLFMCWLYNHRIYLTDMSTHLSNPQKININTPINILQNRNDIFGNTILSVKGLPVMIQSVSSEGFTKIKDEEGNFNNYIKCKIVMVVDNYGA